MRLNIIPFLCGRLHFRPLLKLQKDDVRLSIDGLTEEKTIDSALVIGNFIFESDHVIAKTGELDEVLDPAQRVLPRRFLALRGATAEMALKGRCDDIREGVFPHKGIEFIRSAGIDDHFNSEYFLALPLAF
jgi:hypothetical protein